MNAIRPRFSLRLLLIAFTLVAISCGLVARSIYQIKDRVRRHKAAVATLDVEKLLRITNSNQSPTWYESIVRDWIDEDAFPEPSSYIIGMPHIIRKSSEESQKVLTLLQDVDAVEELVIATDCLSYKASKSISHHDGLKLLKIDCDALEPGAALAFKELKSLKSLEFCYACNDDVLLAAAQMPRLKRLSVHITHLSAVGAEALSQIHSLESMDIRAVDEELPQPAPFLEQLRLLPNLSSIELTFVPINDAAAVALSRISSLKRLKIGYFDSLPVHFLATIAKLRRIESIVVNPAEIASLGSPAPLAGCPELKELYTAAVIYTVDDLRAFRGHPALERMVIRGTIPPVEIQEFLKATPQCELTILPPDAGAWNFAPGLGEHSDSGAASYRLNAGAVESRDHKWKAPWKVFSVR